MDAYKTGQGSLARLIVWVLLLFTVFLGCAELYSWIQDPRSDTALIPLAVFHKLPILGVPLSWKFVLCTFIFVGALWLTKRYMTKPSLVDTLIETEMEMRKVSWPTREESLNATWVVIFVTVAITGLLFSFDAVLRMLFDMVF